jgi:hypothetical protein
MSSWRCFPFVESAPRAYRLKASNAALSSSTSTGTFPPIHIVVSEKSGAPRDTSGIAVCDVAKHMQNLGLFGEVCVVSLVQIIPVRHFSHHPFADMKRPVVRPCRVWLIDGHSMECSDAVQGQNGRIPIASGCGGLARIDDGEIDNDRAAYLKSCTHASYREARAMSGIEFPASKVNLLFTGSPQFVGGFFEPSGGSEKRPREECDDDSGESDDKSVVRLYIGRDTWDQWISGAILCATFFGVFAYAYIMRDNF